MREIELKILDVNVPKLKRQLKKLGAKYLGKHFIHLKGFDYADRRIKKKHDLLRLRTFGKKIQFTYKVHKSAHNYKIVEELETEVKDFAAVEKILLALGLTCTQDLQKYRTSYRLPGVNLEIDEYPNVPAFIELEGTPTTIRQALKQLNIDFKNTNTMTAGELLRHYGVNDKILKF